MILMCSTLAKICRCGLMLHFCLPPLLRQIPSTPLRGFVFSRGAVFSRAGPLASPAHVRVRLSDALSFAQLFAVVRPALFLPLFFRDSVLSRPLALCLLSRYTIISPQCQKPLPLASIHAILTFPLLSCV